MSTSNVTGFAHISLFVRDIARSCRLYQDLLGFAPHDEHVDEKMRILLLKNGDAILELIQHTPPQELATAPGPFNHIALKVQNMDPLVRELRAQGYALENDAPIELPNQFGGIKIIFFAGPDGERVELLQNI